MIFLVLFDNTVQTKPSCPVITHTICPSHQLPVNRNTQRLSTSFFIPWHGLSSPNNTLFDSLRLRLYIRRLNSFHNRCVRTILGVTRYQERITSKQLASAFGMQQSIHDIILERRRSEMVWSTGPHRGGGSRFQLHRVGQTKPPLYTSLSSVSASCSDLLS